MSEYITAVLSAGSLNQLIKRIYTDYAIGNGWLPAWHALTGVTPITIKDKTTGYMLSGLAIV